MMMEGIMVECPVNPDFPNGFWFTPNEERTADPMAWWGKPFILTIANAHRHPIRRLLP
jgi:hypothetical protein